MASFYTGTSKFSQPQLCVINFRTGATLHQRSNMPAQHYTQRYAESYRSTTLGFIAIPRWDFAEVQFAYTAHPNTQ